MKRDVLFEIGLEELPARFIDLAEEQLVNNTKKWLLELRIDFDEVISYSTPRRLAVKIKNIEEAQASLDIAAKGPTEKIAKDSEGNWTKAAIGFTKGQGKSTDDIYIKEIKEIPYIHVSKYIQGEPTYNLLPGFKEVIKSLQFPSNMKWGSGSMRFARPIRWLVALYGNEIIPFEIAHVKTSNITYGHRFLGGKILLETPEIYEEILAENYVIANSKKRKSLIEIGIKNIEKENDYSIVVDPSLLDEVKNLVEFPTVFTGSFNEMYLNLPTEVLITSMKEHQRYFHIEDKQGKLLPYFIGVRNGDSHAIEKVIKGNEKVLHARLADAQFFYEEDRNHSISYYQEKLGNVIYQEKLGTIKDKTKRVQIIAERIGEILSLSEDNKKKIDRAAEICKFDLTTNIVNEFTELQGVIGEKYALKFGENEQVALAIREHYLPNHADGELPQSIIGSVVSIADKLDTIVGSIYIGLKPTSSQDPYGLRRQAVGILRILEEWNWTITVKELFEIPFDLFDQLELDGVNEREIKENILDFIHHRITFLLKEKRIEPDVIQAVLKRGIKNLPYIMNKASLLSAKRNENSFRKIQEALVRVLNLAKNTKDTEINTSLFQTDSERELYNMLAKVTPQFHKFNDAKEADKTLKSLSELADPIYEFFENNMVMTEDKNIRENRLSMMHKISQLILTYADLAEVEWKQNF